jgi:uncharacterized membrane protein
MKFLMKPIGVFHSCARIWYSVSSHLITCIMVFPFWLLSLQTVSSVSDEAVVHAVLFYSHNCGHCHLVITESLPPLFEQYGDQLYVIGVDVSQPGGQTLFLTTLQHFNLERGGVPFLVVGDNYLVGSVDIPDKFPGLINHYLALGGVGWPGIPGLAEAMAPAQPADAPATSESQLEPTPTVTTLSTPDTPTPTNLASTTPQVAALTPTPGLIMTGNQTAGAGINFARDPLGNSLAVIVLVAMILSVGGAVIFFRRTPGVGPVIAMGNSFWNWLIPVLCLIGLGVAVYMAYVETAQVEAVCGPVGDCNTVQQSTYARLFGVFPIGILGVMGYGLILLAWTVGRTARQRLAAFASLALLVMTAFGVLFSIYLTFLEPFVIGATCAWCLTSAIIMTALFWLSLAPARLALSSTSYSINGKHHL